MSCSPSRFPILVAALLAGCGTATTRVFDGFGSESAILTGGQPTPATEFAVSCAPGSVRDASEPLVDEAVTVDLALATLIELDGFARRLKSALVGGPDDRIGPERAGCRLPY